MLGHIPFTVCNAWIVWIERKSFLFQLLLVFLALCLECHSGFLHVRLTSECWLEPCNRADFLNWSSCGLSCLRLFFLSFKHYSCIFLLVVKSFQLFLLLFFLIMYGWIGILSCICGDVIDLVWVDSFFLFGFILTLVIFVFVMVFFIIIVFVLTALIIIIHSCNPIYDMVQDSLSVLELETLKTLLT